MTYQQRNVSKPDNPYKTAGDSVINLRLLTMDGDSMAGVNYSRNS